MTTNAKAPAHVFNFRSPRTWTKSLVIWILLGIAYVAALYFSGHAVGRTPGWYALRFLFAFVAVAVVDVLVARIGWRIIDEITDGMIKMASLTVGTGGVTIVDIHGKTWKATYDEITSVVVEPNPKGRPNVDELCITLKDGMILYTPLHKCSDDTVKEAAMELRARVNHSPAANV